MGSCRSYRVLARLGLVLLIAFAARRAAPAGEPGDRVTYNKGPVLQHVRVVMVLYGGNLSDYIPEVSGSVGTNAPSMEGFYRGIVASPFIDGLSEYSTVDPPQTIGRGTYAGKYQILAGQLVKKARPVSVDDSTIRANLVAAIQSGQLPAATADTVYMIHFPIGVTVTRGSQTSCTTFCGFHSSIGGIYYAILPDLSYCSSGVCGPGFANLCLTASHELVESITDPQFGVSFAWIPEIADQCPFYSSRIRLSDGFDYWVQGYWSDLHASCVNNWVRSDFSISISPSTRTVPPGGSTTYTISTATLQGLPVAIGLNPSGLPPGSAVSFSPAFVTSGQSDTMTVTTPPGTPLGSYGFTILGAASSASHVATATLVVASPAVYEGYLDGADCNVITGWAWDRNQPNTPIFVDILADGAFVATVRADQYRSDLAALGKGNGYHLFNYPTPASLKTGTTRSITVRFSGTSTALPSAKPISIWCAPVPVYEGYVDGVDCNIVTGWAWNRTLPDTPINVDIYTDGRYIGTAAASAYRQDLAAAGKGNGYHVFTFPIPASLHDGYAHAISVRFGGTAQDLIDLSRGPITCH
jgi:hypothetical protein